MKKHYHILIYSLIWGIAILFLIVMLYQNYGNARVINYTGYLRGGSQRLIKQELNGIENDTLLEELDQILAELRTGEGTHGITRCSYPEFQESLTEMEEIWEDFVVQLAAVRAGADTQELFTLSERYFELANIAVSEAEDYSEYLIHVSITVMVLYLIVSLTCLLIWNLHKERQMRKIYYTDDLTNSYNKSAFEIKAKSIMEQFHDEYSILYFDIDGFKRINDNFGYQAGDELLKEIAEQLKQTLDETKECFARTSADNFIILMRSHHHSISEINDGLISRLQKTLAYVNPIEFTYGVYELPKKIDEQIPVMIDKAMIAHKICKGKHDVHILYYNVNLKEELEYENRITSYMQRALENNEFKMYLQPKINIQNDNIIGSEALVRWISSEFGFMPPDSFIPIFEKNGFIAQLDFYMVKQVCEFLQESLKIAQDKTYPISVNISRVTLLEHDFLTRFLAVVSQYDIPNSYLEVELTESAFNGLDDQAMSILKQLQEHGFLVSMDDFGSGYSSLNLLRTMPINVLKLDREFINEQQNTKEALGIVSCIVEMAHLMNLQVICEGIETIEQLHLLKEIGCDFGQGYYFAKPMPLQEFQKDWLKLDVKA